MNGVDAIIFTGGIGENSSKIRYLILKDMEYTGILIDEELVIATDVAKIAVASKQTPRA